MPLTASESLSLDITLPGRICRLGGDNATGKTYFLETLRDAVEAIQPDETHRVNKWLKKNIKIINSYSDEATIRVLKNVKCQLIAIDNADYVFHDHPWLPDHITYERNNQWIIISKTQIEGLGVSGDCVGVMYFDEDTHTIHSSYGIS